MKTLLRTSHRARWSSKAASFRTALTLGVTLGIAAGALRADDEGAGGPGSDTVGAGSTQQGGPPAVSDGKDNDPCDQTGCSDPIELATGEFKLTRTDLVLPGLNEPLEITFQYRSQRMVNGPWGFGWQLGIEQRIFERADGRKIWRVGSGEKIELLQSGSVFVPLDGGYHVELRIDGSDYVIDELLSGNVYRFDSNGLLKEIQNRQGNTTTLTWDDDGGAAPVKFPIQGLNYITAFDYRIKSITSSLGTSVTFSYYAPPSSNAGRLERIDDGYGRSVLYEYTDGRDNLTAVRSPVTDYYDAGALVTGQRRVTTYTYTSGSTGPQTNAPESPLDHNLEQVKDDRNLTQLFNQYDANDRVVSQSAHGGTSTYEYEVSFDGDVVAVDEYDGNGFHHRHLFDAGRNPVEQRTYSAGIHPGFTTPAVTRYGYNGDDEAEVVTFPLGNGIERTYVDGKLTDLTRRQVTGQSTTGDIQWVYTYNSGKSYKPLGTVTDPLGNVTTYRYDFEESGAVDLNDDGVTDQSMGNVVRIEFPDLTLPDGTTVLSPVWRKLQYNADGQLTKVIDEEGRVTEYAYFTSGGSFGLLQSMVVYPSTGVSLTTTFTYDGFGFLDVVTDPRLNATDYDYNAVGELVRVLRPEGAEQRFGYDANGNLVRVETRNLDETGAPQSPEWILRTCQFDAWNRMTSCTEDVTGSTTRTTTYEYDFLGNLSKLVTPEGREQTFEYDERGTLWRQVRGAGTSLASTRLWHVDRNGNVVQSVDGRGGVTAFERDLFDRTQAVVDPAGNRVEMDLSDRDEVLVRRLYDPIGGSTLMARTLQEFDELGRLIKSTADPIAGGLQPSVTWFERDRTGLLVASRTPRGEFTTYDYDDAGRLKTVEDPLGNRLEYTLDANGNPEVVTSFEEVLGGTESYALETVFDDLNRPEVRRRYSQGVPVGSGAPLVTSMGWDSRSQLVSVTDPINRVMRTNYDLAGRPTSTVEDAVGLAITTGYIHDDDDLLITLTDPDSKATSWIHDSLGRVQEIDYAVGGSELFTHDGEDAVKTHTRQDGVVTTLTYRADGALSSRTVGTLREEFDWAAVGVPREARVLVSGLVRSRVGRTFDGLGRVASEAQGDFTVQFGYDESHNPRTVTWPDAYALTQEFDELERLEQLKEGAIVVAEWTWSGPARVASRATGQTLGLVTTYLWDGYQRLEGLDSGTVHDVAYGYDALDRRCWKQSQHLTGQPIDVYGYDGGSRLVGVWADAGSAVCAQAPSTWASHFDVTVSPGESRTQTALDTGGGPVATSYNGGSVDALHRYTNVGGVGRDYDENGNLTADGTLTYEYDAWNRLTAVKTPPPMVTERARYEHDALGRRTKKFESGVVTHYVYSGARLIAEYEEVPPAAPTLARRYVHGVGLDELVVLDSGASRYYAFGDALGSVEVLSDATGTWAELYDYDAFGNPSVTDGAGTPITNGYGLPGSAVGNALWFTGARYDGESGQYHMRARQYEPGAGRFVSRDPLGYVDSANAYLYGFNDPANWVDPYGTEAQSGPGWKNLGSPTRRRTEKEQRAHEFALQWANANREELRTIDRAQRNYEFALQYTTKVRNVSATATVVLGTVVAAPTALSVGSSAAGWIGAQGSAASSAVVSQGARLVAGAGALTPMLQQAYLRAHLWLSSNAPAVATILWDTEVILASSQSGPGGVGAVTCPVGSAIVPRMAEVTRWGRPGLLPGDWVQMGRNTLWNWLKTGKWQPNWFPGSNQYAARASGETFQVLKSTLRFPDEFGGVFSPFNWIKYLLGQRRYLP